MQRLYSMFPHGGPGVGLLLLRLAAAAMFALNVSRLVDSSSKPLQIVAITLTALIAVFLCAGFLTPIITVIAGVVGILTLFFAEPGNVISILRILTFAALFFLGPGAYSIDAKLFGLRVTVVPPRKN